MKIEQTLRGARICLRNYEKSDLPFLTDMWFDEENGKYLSDPTRECVDERYQQALDTLGESEKGYFLVAELANSKESIGSACIFPNEDESAYEIGYCIHKSKWRQGYGCEVVGLMIEWLKVQGVEKVIAEAAAANVASNALLKKLGFALARASEFKKYNTGITYPSNVYERNISD